MSIASAAVVSSYDACPRLHRGISALAAVALGVASLALGIGPAAADEEDEKAESTVAAEAQAPEADDRAEGDAEDRKAGASEEADAKELAVRDERRQDCRRVRLTGSRLPKVVCTTVSQTAVDTAQQEQAAREFLRRQEERSTIARPAGPDDVFQRSGLPGL